MASPHHHIAAIIAKAPEYQSAGADEAEAAPSARPRSWGDSVTGMNAEWALVLMGSRAVVVHEQTAGPIEDRIRVISIDAFKSWLLNRLTQVREKDGSVKTVTWADAWLRSRTRRQYCGIEFQPDPGIPRRPTAT